ncbi:MAG: histidine triad nucleotide-binding protein [Lautropia sp.]|nr:histidine triad nucleotide-binding protein [Lautropia sp.]
MSNPVAAERSQCIFCRIADGDLPARKIHEDEQAIVFHDINPAAPVHFLIIPKQHVVNLYDGTAHPALLGHLMSLCGPLARAQGLEDGFKVQIHNGPKGGQEVYHLHIHVMGGVGSRPVQAG